MLTSTASFAFDRPNTANYPPLDALEPALIHSMTAPIVKRQKIVDSRVVHESRFDWALDVYFSHNRFIGRSLLTSASSVKAVFSRQVAAIHGSSPSGNGDPRQPSCGKQARRVLCRS